MDFGQTPMLMDSKITNRALIWAFDTKKGAIDNYNLIWEASDVCVENCLRRECIYKENCCKENKEVQDGKTYYQYRYIS